MADRKKHARSRARRVVSVLSLVVLIGVVAALAVYVYSYVQGQAAYDRVADIAFEVPPSSASAPDATDEAGETQLFTLTVDWDALFAINPDIVGWIYMPDTEINYPVVRGSDNVRYLTYNFGGEVSANWLPTFGTPFLLAENAADFSDANNVIQAHNMANGTMFAKIPELMDATEFNAHRRVFLLTPSGNFRLTSISMVVSAPYEAVLKTSFGTQEEFQSYVQGLVDRSVVIPEPAAPPVSEVSKLFMFSTCTSDNGQYRSILVCMATEFEPRTTQSATNRATGT